MVKSTVECVHNRIFFLYPFIVFFYYIIYTVLQCDLPPLRPHYGEAPGRDLNPGWAAPRQGHYPVTTPPPPEYWFTLQKEKLRTFKAKGS